MSTSKLTIIHHDRQLKLWVINKPSGIAVHGGKQIKSDLLSILRDQFQKKFYLIHRIDQQTDGLVCLTDNMEKVFTLSKLLKRSRKFYLMIVKGKFSSKKMLIQNNLTITKGAGQKQQWSETKLKVIQSFSSYTLLSAELITGRTHQIRKHLQEIGHPILGDDKYGDFDLNRKLQNQWPNLYPFKLPLFLTANHLLLNTPTKKLNLTCPLSTEFEKFLNIYNVRYLK